MNFVKDIFSVIGSAIVFLLAIPVALTIVAYLGYFFGIVVAFTSSYVLAGQYGIEFDNIPFIVAWLFVAAAILGSVRGKEVIIKKDGE